MVVEVSGAIEDPFGEAGPVHRLWPVLESLAGRMGGSWHALDGRYSWGQVYRRAGFTDAIQASRVAGDGESKKSLFALRLDLHTHGSSARNPAVLVKGGLLLEYDGGVGTAATFRFEMEIERALLGVGSAAVATGSRAPSSKAAAERLMSGDAPAPPGVCALLGDIVAATRPRWGRVTAGVPARASLFDSAPRVGWLTYLSRGPALPVIPPPIEIVEVPALGWILVAAPRPPETGSAEGDASLAHVRHVLGARVLLDGPSYPSPAAPEALAPAPEPAPPAAPAPVIPSYLKTPPASASAAVPSSQGQAATPAAPPPLARPTPFTTETATLDVSKILRPSVPFQPNIPSAAAAARPPELGPSPARAADSASSAGATAPGARASMSTETAPVDIAKLFRAAVPFPPGAPGATSPSPGATRPAAAPPQGPQRRLVRFDPQTGQALAQPYWEELPAAEKKA